MDLYQKFNIPRPEPFSNNLNILVAESHNELRLIIVHHLKKLGFQNVRQSRDGRAAIRELHESRAQIALVSDDLPGLAGLELLRELREEPSITRETFILLSRPLLKNEVMLAVETGIDDLMVRPITANDILPKLRNAYAVFTNPKNPERVYEFAKEQMRKENYDQAEAVYHELSKLAERAARPHVGLARIHEKRGHMDKAMAAIDTAIEKNPSYTHAFSFRGELHVKGNKFDKAIEDFRTAASLSPLNLSRYESACKILLERELIEPCIEILEVAIASGLTHPFVVERLGYCYFKQKDFPRALKYLKQAAIGDPENIRYQNSLAICYRDSEMFEEALEVYNQILKKENKNHLVLFNKALIFVHMKKNDEAVKLLKRVLSIDPTFVKAREKIVEIGADPDGA